VNHLAMLCRKKVFFSSFFPAVIANEVKQSPDIKTNEVLIKRDCFAVYAARNDRISTCPSQVRMPYGSLGRRACLCRRQPPQKF